MWGGKWAKIVEIEKVREKWMEAEDMMGAR